MEIKVLNSEKLLKIEDNLGEKLTNLDVEDIDGVPSISVKADILKELNDNSKANPAGIVFSQDEKVYLPVYYYLGIADLISDIVYKDGDKFNLMPINLNILKSVVSSYTGVTQLKNGRNLNAQWVAYYYLTDGSKSARTTLGYFYTLQDSALIREYTRLALKVNCTPTGLVITYNTLEDFYKKVIVSTFIKKQQSYTDRIERLSHARRQSTGNGLRINSNSVALTLTYDNKKHLLGRFKDERTALIYRNAYITNNNIDLPLADLDISLEEQLELAKSIVPNDISTSGIKKTKTSSASSRFIGVSYLSNHDNFRVDVKDRETKKNIYILATKDEEIAAMAYNVYTVDKGVAKEPVNNVGLTLEEQRQKIIEYFRSSKRKIPKALVYLFENEKPRSFIKYREPVQNRATPTEQ